MGGLESVLLVSVLVRCIDNLSPIMRMMGINSISSMGLMAGGAATVAAAIIGIGAASIHAAEGFDQAMHKVAGLTTLIQDSGHDMQYWEDQILALAPTIDVAPTKLAQALYFVASAGVPAGKVMDVLKYSAMAAAATMGDMKQVADLVTSAMNAFKNQNLSAAHATDVIVDAVKNGKVEMHALETSFAFVGVTGMAARFSIEEVAAAVSTLTQVSGNTAARRVQMDLDNLMRRLGDVAGIAKTAKKLGYAFDEAKFAGMGLIDRLKTMMNTAGFTTDSLKQLWEASGHNQQVYEQMALKAALANHNFQLLAGGAAAMIPSVILLNDKGVTFNKIFNEMANQTGTTQQAFDVMRQSTGQLMNMLKVTAESILTELGLRLLPVVNGLIQAFIGTGRSILVMLQSAPKINDLKWALLGIAIVVGGILAESIAGIVIASAPFLLILTAIVGAGILLGMAIRAVVAHFGGWDAIMRRIHPLIVQVQQAFAAAGTEIQKAFANPEIQKALRELQAQLPALLPVLQGIATVVGAVLVVAFNLFVASIVGIAGALPGVIQVFTGLAQVIASIGRIVGDLLSGNWSDLPAAFTAVGEGMKTAILGSLKAVEGGMSGFLGHFGNMLDGAQKQADHAVAVQKNAQAQQLLAQDEHQLRATASTIQHLEEHKAVLQKALTSEHDVRKRHEIANQIMAVTTQINGQQHHQAALKQHAHRLQSAMQTNSGGRSWAQAQAQHLGEMGGKLGAATQGAFAHVKHGVQAKLAEAGAHVKAFGTAVTTTLHNGLEAAKDAVLAPIHAMGGAFLWLLHHNRYFRHLVIAIRTAVASIGIYLHAIVEKVTTKLHEMGSAIKTKATEAWKHFITAVTDAKTKVDTKVHEILTFITDKIEDFKTLVHDKAVEAWDKFIKPIVDAKTKADTAVNDNIIQPIKDKWNDMVTWLSGAGTNLMKMIGDDIRNGAHWVSEAAKFALKGLGNWLGFQSPAPNVPESAYWGSNLARMFAASLLEGGSEVENAAATVLRRAQGQMSGGNVGASGSGSTSGSLALAAASGGGGGGNVTHIHNWEGAFPNATSTETIVAAIRQVQQDDYRATKRAGYGGGLGAAISIR